MGESIFQYYSEALAEGIKTKPVIIGPFTFLKLADYKGNKKLKDFVEDTVKAYCDIFAKLNELGVEWVQIDEPILVTDLSEDDIYIFTGIYHELLKYKDNLKVLIQTYFGYVRDCYNEITGLPFDGIGLDFVEGKKSLELMRENSFPRHIALFAGVVNGKNIWRNCYQKSLEILNDLSQYVERENIVINTSCSLLHVPYTLKNEEELSESCKAHFAFAEEKLTELAELKELFGNENYLSNEKYYNNLVLFTSKTGSVNAEVKEKMDALTEKDFSRQPEFNERAKLQNDFFKLPLLPTTTIGSFPQTAEVKANRTKLKKGEISKEQYKENVNRKIEECIALQNKIGIDVLVHGEFERNDMVEYFGEHLNGYLFTRNAWVQSYGTRCVKPPDIIFIGESVSILISAFLVLMKVKETEKEIVQEKEPRREGKEFSKEQNKRFSAGNSLSILLKPVLIAYMILSACNTFSYAQNYFSLPLFLDSVFPGNSSNYFGILMMVNGIFIICFTPLITKITVKYSPVFNMFISGLFYAIGFGMHFFIQSLYLIILATVFWTLGEILFNTNFTVYVVEKSLYDFRARMISISSIITKSAIIINPMIMGKIIQIGGTCIVWLIVFFIMFTASSGMLYLSLLESRRKISDTGTVRL